MSANQRNTFLMVCLSCAKKQVFIPSIVPNIMRSLPTHPHHQIGAYERSTSSPRLTALWWTRARSSEGDNTRDTSRRSQWRKEHRYLSHPQES